jgi:hypothetical protein
MIRDKEKLEKEAKESYISNKLKTIFKTNFWHKEYPFHSLMREKPTINGKVIGCCLLWDKIKETDRLNEMAYKKTFGYHFKRFIANTVMTVGCLMACCLIGWVLYTF